MDIPFPHEALPSSSHLALVEILNVQLLLHIQVDGEEGFELLEVMFGYLFGVEW